MAFNSFNSGHNEAVESKLVKFAENPKFEVKTTEITNKNQEVKVHEVVEKQEGMTNTKTWGKVLKTNCTGIHAVI